MLLGVFDVISPAVTWVGVGAAATLLGVALFSPLLVKPIAAVVGAPLERLRGVPGRLARENAVRNPARTASTAAALMIGLALVSFVTVFAAGLQGSIDDAIDKTIAGDADRLQRRRLLRHPRSETVDAVAGGRGVDIASPLRYTQDDVEGGGRGLPDPDRPGDRGPGALARLEGGLAGAAHRTWVRPTP